MKCSCIWLLTSSFSNILLIAAIMYAVIKVPLFLDLDGSLSVLKLRSCHVLQKVVWYKKM